MSGYCVQARDVNTGSCAHVLQDRDCWVASEGTAAAPSTRLFPARRVGPVVPDHTIFNKKRKSASPSLKIRAQIFIDYLDGQRNICVCESAFRPSICRFYLLDTKPNPSTIGPTSLSFPIWHPAISTEESYNPARLFPSLFSSEIPYISS